MRISVFGLGYVGTVTAACFAQQGHQVIGVDINTVKVNMINNGHSPVIEQGIDNIISQMVDEGQLTATTDGFAAVLDSELSLICVGTPSKNNGSLDLTFVKRVCRDIGQSLKGKNDFHTIVLRSTVLPGTTSDVVIPILEESSNRILGRDFGICHNPEFLREGTSVEDFYNPPFTVIGRLDSQAAEITASLYQDLNAPIMHISLEAAEIIKYACNAFHALKITFANEMGNICKSHGIDSFQVMDVFCMDNKLNLSPYYLKPGFAFGGSCLPKDLRALLYDGHHKDLSLPVLEAILPSNDNQIKRCINLVEKLGYKKVGVLGFSFKAGTDDLRESPLVELIEVLYGKGFQIKIYDRNVSLARLHGANKAYIEREIPHISCLMCDTIDDVIDHSDVIIIGNKSQEFSEALKKVHQGQHIIDLVRIEAEVKYSNELYDGICW